MWLPIGVSPIRTPSTQTSAHGTALMFIATFGTAIDSVAVLPGATWTVRISENPRLSLTRRSWRFPAGSMILADAVDPITAPASVTLMGIGDVIESQPAAGPAGVLDAAGGVGFAAGLTEPVVAATADPTAMAGRSNWT